MNKTVSLMMASAIAVFAMAGPTIARPALKDVPEVREGIIYAGMAYEISRRCDGISARMWRGMNYLQSLKRRAQELGYSDAEIEAYIDDSAEKNRLEGIARQQLAQLGVVRDDPATYCAVGRSQMAANTRVGWLLR